MRLRTLVAAVAVTLPGTAVVATQAPAAAAAADLVPPATITVCRVTYGNGEAATVPFKEYVKDVLPQEFGSRGPAGYLEAGAMAIKSYAWYFVVNPTSDRCHITDGGNHQHYRPGDDTPPRTAATDAAVDRTWHIRMDAGGLPVHAQYCNRYCDIFAPGRHLDQGEARAEGADGLSFGHILRHHYRAVDGLTLRDWRAGHAVGFVGAPFVLDGEPLQMTAGVSGVDPGDDRAEVVLRAACNSGGGADVREIQRVPVTQGPDGEGRAAFDTDALRACSNGDIPVRAILTVNGYHVASDEAMVTRPWRSATPRLVGRLAATDDPVAGAIAISQALFTSAPVGGASDDLGELIRALLGIPEPGDGGDSPLASARAVVLARAEQYADALAATGLAGRSAPILFNPGGQAARLNPAVALEIDRVLGYQGVVHLVGGEAALPPAIRTDLEARGYTVVRHAGATRVQTALTVADAIHAERGGVTTVMVARAYPDGSAGWADAVTGGAYAATGRHPVLLTAPDRLDDAVEAWIERSGATEAVLLGGTEAVSADAEQRLDLPVMRARGPTRDGTAVAVADRLWLRPGGPAVRAALLVETYSDAAWPFALAGAVYAARLGAPQLAVNGTVPRTTTGAWLDAHPDLPAIVLGGGGIVPPDVEVAASGLPAG